jgi:hypothetical protein
MTPQAWYKRGLIRKAGGSVLGKRGGVSANLTARAIEAWKREAVATPVEARLPSAEGWRSAALKAIREVPMEPGAHVGAHPQRARMSAKFTLL